MEIRFAESLHSSDRFSKIYGNWGASYEVEASTQLPYCIDGWCNFDWFSKHGRSEGLDNPTRVQIATVSLGVRFPYQFCERFTGYLGIGPTISRIWIKNNSECSRGKTSKLLIGGVLKSGVIYSLCGNIFCDFFADYIYQPVHFETQVDIGGLKLGAGVGIEF